MICTAKEISQFSSHSLLSLKQIGQHVNTQKTLMEKFGIVQLYEPKEPQKIMSLQSKLTADHIMRCINNNSPATNPKNKSPLDPAEIQYILFHAMVFDSFNHVPSEEEIESKLKELINGCNDSELINFARAWVDIHHFVNEDQECSILDSPAFFPNNQDETLNEKRKPELSVDSYNPNLERARYQKLLEKEQVGTFLLRPSSFQRKKQADCIFDFFVITLKVGEGIFKDNLIVKEFGRGWTLTGARAEKKTGVIVLDPIRQYFPCFFDALSHYLSLFSLDLKNVKRYSKDQLLEVYTDISKTLCKKKEDKYSFDGFFYSTPLK